MCVCSVCVYVCARTIYNKASQPASKRKKKQMNINVNDERGGGRGRGGGCEKKMSVSERKQKPLFRLVEAQKSEDEAAKEN